LKHTSQHYNITNSFYFWLSIAKDPKNVVWLISGRDGEFLDEHWGDIPNLGLSAEHGSFVKGPGATEWINMTEHMDMSWMGEVEEIFRYYTEVSVCLMTPYDIANLSDSSERAVVPLKSRRPPSHGTGGNVTHLS